MVLLFLLSVTSVASYLSKNAPAMMQEQMTASAWNEDADVSPSAAMIRYAREKVATNTTNAVEPRGLHEAGKSCDQNWTYNHVTASNRSTRCSTDDETTCLNEFSCNCDSDTAIKWRICKWIPVDPVDATTPFGCFIISEANDMPHGRDGCQASDMLESKLPHIYCNNATNLGGCVSSRND